VVENGRVVEDGAPADLASRPSRYRELLDAENHLRERIWSDPHWRHIRAADGLIAELESSNVSLTIETAAVS
jgi:ATP-binding cassette subfamily B protein